MIHCHGVGCVADTIAVKKLEGAGATINVNIDVVPLVYAQVLLCYCCWCNKGSCNICVVYCLNHDSGSLPRYLWDIVFTSKGEDNVISFDAADWIWIYILVV